MWAKVQHAGSSKCGKFHKWTNGKPLCGIKNKPCAKNREKQPYNSCAFCVKLAEGGNWHEVHNCRAIPVNGPNCVTKIRSWGLRKAQEVPQ